MKDNPKIVVVSEAFPPDYSGAGLSAQFLSSKLYRNNMLYKVITRTKGKINNRSNHYFIDEDSFFRVVFFHKLLIRFAHNKILKPFILLIDFPLVFFKTTSFFLKNRNSISLFFFVSTKWISLILSFWCVLFNKMYIIETTLIGNDDPMPNPAKRFNWINKRIKDYQFRNASAITNISQLLADQCLNAGLPKNKIHIISRSINIQKFYPKTLDEKNKLREKLLGNISTAPIIMFAGVLIKRKGIDIVYNTFKKIIVEKPDAVLLMIGPEGPPGQDNYLRQIKNEIKLNSLDKNVIFTGAVENIEEYYNISDVFFFPSRKEGFGRVYIEAMASGIPVVAKEITGITDFIFTNGYDGIILESDDYNEYSNTIKKLISNPTQRKQIRANALKTVTERFSEQAVVKKYDALFNDVLKSQYAKEC